MFNTLKDVFDVARFIHRVTHSFVMWAAGSVMVGKFAGDYATQVVLRAWGGGPLYAPEDLPLMAVAIATGLVLVLGKHSKDWSERAIKAAEEAAEEVAEEVDDG